MSRMIDPHQDLLHLKIETIYAYIVRDANGDEGLPAVGDGNTVMPLIGADPERLGKYRKLAQDIADQSGREVQEVQFTVRKLISVIRPQHTKN